MSDHIKVLIRANSDGQLSYYLRKKGQDGIKFGSISSKVKPDEEFEIVVDRGTIIFEG